MTIYLDFDGTMVTHQYPEIGEEVPGAVRTVKDLILTNYNVVLNTYRADIGLKELHAAIAWLKERGIDITFVEAKIYPAFFGEFGQDYFIDDQACNAPLLENGSVNWQVVRNHFGFWA